MNSPRRFVVRMVVFVVLATGVAGALLPTLAGAFLTNPTLNGLIGAVLLIGVAYSFRQVLALYPESRWLREVESPYQDVVVSSRSPKLLAPIARVLREQSTERRAVLSTLAMRSLLDGVSIRLEETRDLSRYMVGLLIFLGLLGTFWGLLQTVDSVGSVIGGLSVAEEDLLEMFSTLKSGLERPLAGMGTAFSSSLFGLGGSLVLGFLDLQAGQAQNQFYNDLEEWLSARARITTTAAIDTNEVRDGAPVPIYVQALLEQTAESIEELQKVLARGEDRRRVTEQSMTQIAQQMATLVDQMRSDHRTMTRLAETLSAGQERGFDEAALDHLRNLNLQITRLVDESREGREALLQGFRGEIKLLARTISADAQSPDGRS